MLNNFWKGNARHLLRRSHQNGCQQCLLNSVAHLEWSSLSRWQEIPKKQGNRVAVSTPKAQLLLHTYSLLRKLSGSITHLNAGFILKDDSQHNFCFLTFQWLNAAMQIEDEWSVVLMSASRAVLFKTPNHFAKQWRVLAPCKCWINVPWFKEHF